MHFTVHFRSEKVYQQDLSYGLVFIPCPCWTKGNRIVINLNRENPHYQMGSVRKLIEKERLDQWLGEQPQAIVLVHQIGHGTEKYKQKLLNDLDNEGFAVQVFDGTVAG